MVSSAVGDRTILRPKRDELKFPGTKVTDRTMDEDDGVARALFEKGEVGVRKVEEVHGGESGCEWKVGSAK
jgi:hypothetical protein